MMRPPRTTPKAITAGLILIALSACSSGGGGGGSDESDNNPGAGVNPPDVKPQLTLDLGAPSTNPIVVPPSSVATPVQLLSVVSGTFYPDQLVVDEVDQQGGLIEPSVVLLKDDGVGPDAFRGDRTYSGSLSIYSIDSTERYFQVRADNNGEEVRSGVGSFWVSGCPARARPSNPEKIVLDPKTGAYLFANEATITVANDVPPDLAAINALLTEVQGRVVGCIPALRQYLVEFPDAQSADGVYQAIDILEEQTEIISASPNTKTLDLPKSAVSPCNGDDCQWYLQRIRAPEAWNIAGGGDEQQSVAVIDFGVDCNHPDLNCDGNVYNQDLIDHGTGVAGLISARNREGSNLVGVAWNTTLHPYSFIGAGGSQYKMSELITASLSQETTKVINISAATAIDPNHQIRDAICTAIASGRLVVAAAGNAHSANQCELQNTFPASYNTAGQCDNGVRLQDGLLTVGATDFDNNLAEWEEGEVCSNTLHVDLFAPGKGIYTASSIDNYATKDGTSYAAPLVAGAAAVVWGAQPHLSATEVHQQLLNSAARINTNDERVADKAFLDLFKAVGGVDGKPNIKPDAIPSDTLTNVARDRLITFESFTVSGIDAASPIDIEGGYYAIEEGPFRSAAAMVRRGEKVTVQVRSSAQFSDLSEAELVIGGVIGTFSVETEAEDTRPDQFHLVDVTGAPVDTVMLSNTATIPGINTDTPMSISGGEYSVDGGPFTSAPGTVNQNQNIQLRVNSSGTPATSTTATITIGDVSVPFTVTTEALDIEPTPFQFTAAADVALETEYTSNDVEIQGINSPAFISISGGVYSIDDGAYTDTAGEIHSGQYVRVRQVSADTPQTSTYATLTVGTLDATYRVTTRAAAQSVESFRFTDQTGIAMGTLVYSNPVTVAGVTTPVSIVIDNGEYRVNGGEFTSYAGQVGAGDQIELRLQAAATPSTLEEATLTVGDAQGVFRVTTIAAVTQPDDFSLIYEGRVEPSTLVTSDPITVNGINTSTDITVVNGEYQINDGSFSSEPGTVNNGDRVVLRLIASEEAGTTTEAILTIGGVSEKFAVTTVAADTTPDAFGFTDATGVALDTLTESDSITITGINTGTAISVSGGEYRINNNDYTREAGIVYEGDTVSVRIQSAADFDTAREAVLTIGGVSAVFEVTTDLDREPDPFSFISLDDQPLNTLITSNTVAINGIADGTEIAIINGEYSIDDGDFAERSGLINAGQTVTVRLTSADTAETTSTATLTVGYAEQSFTVTTIAHESDPPEAAIVFPPQYSLTDLDTVIVRGIASDRSGIATIDVNGTAADYDPETTSWQAKVPLDPGDNTLTATIMDTQSNQSTRSIAIRRTPLGKELNHIRIDANNNRFLAIENDELVAIDQDTGAIEIISGRGIPDNANLLSQARDLQINADSTRALVLASPNNISMIVNIDLLTGERTIVSQDEYAEPEGTYHQIYDLVAHPNGDHLFIADSQGLIELDLNSRTRRFVYKAVGIRGLAWDSANDRLVMTQGRQGLIAFHPNDGSTQVLANNNMATDTSEVSFGSLNGIALDELHNLAYTVGSSETDTIIETNLSTGSRRLVSDNTVAVDASTTSFSNLSPYIALDKANNQLLVTDRGSVIGIDITSGERSVLIQGLEAAFGIRFIPETETVVVLSRSHSTLHSFALGDTATTMISDNSLAVESSTATFGDAWAMALHPDGSRAYIGDWDSDSVFSVDFETGHRETVSDNSDIGEDHTLISPESLLWIEREDRALVLDSGRRSIVDINIDTAARSILSSTLPPNNANALILPTDMVMSPTGEALVLDRGIPAVVATNTNTGERRIWGRIAGNTPWLIGMEFNPSDGSLLIYSRLDGIARLNSGGISESLTRDNAWQVIYDNDADNVLARTPGPSGPLGRLLRLNLATGARTLIPVAPTQSDEILLDHPVDVALNTATQTAYVVDELTQAIFRVSLVTGERTLFASNDIAQATSDIEFERLAGIAVDATNNRLLVSDQGHQALIAVDLTSANRTLISDVDMIHPGPIAVDSGGDFAYVVEAFNRVIRIELATGERLLIASNSIATTTSDIDFSSLKDIALDERNQRVMVTEQVANAVIAVDLETGTRTEYLSRNTPVYGGSSTISPYYLVLDATSNRLIVIDNFLNNLYWADLDTGVRRRVSRPTNLLMETFGLRGADYNATNETLILVEGYRDAVIAVDMQTGERVVLSQ